MLALIDQVVDIFQEYNGGSLYMVIFTCGLVYLWVTEEEKGKRTLLVYGSACFFALFFLPVFTYAMFLVFEGETYYRFLWFLPMQVVIAYAAVRMIVIQKNFFRKLVIGLLACFILVNSGTFTYSNPVFEKAENPYHLPQTVVDICDEIKPEPGEDWVMAVMPAEMISFVRQYTADIHMPYGRAVLIARWNLGHPLFETMQEPVIDVEKLVTQAKEYGCHYIVLMDQRVPEGSLEKYGYHLVSRVDGYNIYLDEENDRGISMKINFHTP